VHTADLRFKEIEHKYIVGDEFDLQAFRHTLTRLGPTRAYSIRVRDRYYLTEGRQQRRFVIRHRFDAQLQHLTIKTVGSDTEVRDEVNVDLGQHAGDQASQVEAFVERLGVRWSGTVHKDVDVWYFEDCEVVHYLASAGSRSVRCVEFEARRGTSLADAIAIVDTFERATGFSGLVRSRLSLPQILFPELSGLLATSV
jgi:adenylate cyclase class IV